MSKEKKNPESKLYAFWKYDLPPGMLGAEVERVDGDMVYAKGYDGWFKSIKILGGEKGRLALMKLNMLQEEYREKDTALREEYVQLAKKNIGLQ
jgi:hypothetical protein